MTDVLRGRQRSRPAGPAAHRPSVVLHGGLAALAAAVSGLAVLAAVVLVAWVADARSGSSGGDAVRAAADAWLLAHGGGLSLPTGRVRGVPLGLSLLAGVVLHRAGASLARAVSVTDLRSAARATGALTAVYGLAAAAVARLAATEAVSSSAVAAGLGATVLAAAAGGSGVVRGADRTDALREVLPAWVPPLARAVAVAVLGLLGAGLALVLISLAAHGGRFAQLSATLDPGLAGTAVLILGCLLLLPNAALWAAAYAAGPGFAVGAGTGISPFGATLGPVPAFPLLAALPQDDTPPAAVRVVLLLPMLAGAAAGAVLARRLPAAEPATGSAAPGAGPAGWTRTAGLGLLTGAVAALVLALAGTLAGGSLGGGHLSTVGPSGWRMALALAVEIGVPAALTAALLPARQTRAEPGGAGEPSDPPG